MSEGVGCQRHSELGVVLRDQIHRMEPAVDDCGRHRAVCVAIDQHTSAWRASAQQRKCVQRRWCREWRESSRRCHMPQPAVASVAGRACHPGNRTSSPGGRRTCFDRVRRRPAADGRPPRSFDRTRAAARNARTVASSATMPGRREDKPRWRTSSNAAVSGTLGEWILASVKS